MTQEPRIGDNELMVQFRAPAGARNRGLHAQIQDGADAGRRMLEVAFPVHGNGAGPGTAGS